MEHAGCKAKFSQPFDSAEIPDQVITHSNEPIAVMPVEDYEKLVRKEGSLLAFYEGTSA